MCLGIPGEIVAMEAPSAAAGLVQGTISFGGVRKRVCLAYVPEARVGDYVVVHAGFALSVIAPQRARGVVFCTFGDMLGVPGSWETLLAVRSRGGDVRVVYSPLDALALAVKHPDRQVVFLAVGFETTAPTTAAAVLEADRLELENIS